MLLFSFVYVIYLNSVSYATCPLIFIDKAYTFSIINLFIETFLKNLKSNSV